jgi:hypothetical protein
MSSQPRIMSGVGELKSWFNEGKRKKSRYMLQCIDAFNKTQYPLYFDTYKEGMEIIKRVEGPNQCFNLRIPFKKQLNGGMSRFPSPPEQYRAPAGKTPSKKKVCKSKKEAVVEDTTDEDVEDPVWKPLIFSVTWYRSPSRDPVQHLASASSEEMEKALIVAGGYIRDGSSFYHSAIFNDEKTTHVWYEDHMERGDIDMSKYRGISLLCWEYY